MSEGIFNLAGKTALVTGGTSGIGFAIAKGLQQAGATVWIHGKEQERTKQIAEENGFRFVAADLLDKNQRREMVAEFCEKVAVLDILFNNAGFEYHSPVGEADEEYLDSIYEVNTRAPYFFVRDLLPLLKKSKAGSIVNVTSIHQEVPVRQNSSYCMSKASLGMFTKVAALEFAKWNIRVNSLAPGAISTEMNKELLKQYDFNQWIPLGRVGSVQDMVGPAVFLASEASSYMTGATLVIDGGYTQNLLRY